MSTYSKIEWTQCTWNPTTGCTKISPGCRYCYAATMAHRLQAMNVKGYENGFDVTVLPERLKQPLQRKKPTVFFVDSMSDLFHEKIPNEFIREVFEIMRKSSQHIFQVLTKRAERMALCCENVSVPPNSWLGVSVEDRKYGVPRINILRQVEAKVRFLSIEPLLENLGELDLTGIHWVIVGGESGPKGRPMKKEWVERIHQQCQEQHVPFFFKQWGRWGEDGKKRPKKHNGRMFLGQTWDEQPIISED